MNYTVSKCVTLTIIIHLINSQNDDLKFNIIEYIHLFSEIQNKTKNTQK